MDIFQFINNGYYANLEQGLIVNGLYTKLWVERYRECGSFELTAPLNSGLRVTLPPGTFISHTESDEIMIVENHELVDDGDNEPILKITGRSLETFFENRFVGSNRIFPSYDSVTSGAVYFEFSYPHEQARAIIRMFCYESELLAGNIYDRIPYMESHYDTTGIGPGTGELEDRRLVRVGSLYKALLEILVTNNLGIKIVRPYRDVYIDDGTITPGNLAFVTHKGRDMRDSVLFSHDSGEIDKANYLWSNKNNYNGAFVVGKWVIIRLDSPKTDYERKYLYVDGTDIDQDQTEYPTGMALTWIEAAMRTRGRSALAAQKPIGLTNVEVSKDMSILPAYREHYGMGDLVSVDLITAVDSVEWYKGLGMRVTEHVEIEDDDGYRAYPTLETDVPVEE